MSLVALSLGSPVARRPSVSPTYCSRAPRCSPRVTNSTKSPTPITSTRPAGSASFSPAGVGIVRARLQVYSWDLAEAKRALRDGSWVAGVSAGGVHAPDGTRVVGTALVLGVLGELIDLLFAVSTLTGVRQHLDVPTIDIQTDQFCRSMLGVEFKAHGDLYGSTMMMKLLRENSGLRSLGLFLSPNCRQTACEEMGYVDDEAVLPPLRNACAPSARRRSDGHSAT